MQDGLRGIGQLQLAPDQSSGPINLYRLPISQITQLE